MGKFYKNREYCGLVGFLTGDAFKTERQLPEIVSDRRPVNITINVNLGKEKSNSYTDLIKSIVELSR